MKEPKLLKRALLDIALSVPLQELHWPELNDLGIEVWLRRDDAISHTYSGNKLYKLFFNIKKALTEKKQILLSFGGPWSNHLHALAALGVEQGIKTIGVVRGSSEQKPTAMLNDVSAWGMRICHLNRLDYAQNNLAALPQEVYEGILSGEIYVIPEGGDNLEGVFGCQVLAQAIGQQMDGSAYTLCSATATGTTLSGLVSASPSNCNNLAISVLKGQDTITPRVNQYLSHPEINNYLPEFYKSKQKKDFQVSFDHHHGGYAKTNTQLMEFIENFNVICGVPLDPVYTGKLLFAVRALAQGGYWPMETKLVILHSGGLQGRRGF